jgi:hypothetical protein
LASNFSDDDVLSPQAPDGGGTPSSPAGESKAFARFRSCRWQQLPDGANQEFCTHREVKPYAGTQGFDPEAWCLECPHYKLRRTPKKRQTSDDYGY